MKNSNRGKMNRSKRPGNATYRTPSQFRVQKANNIAKNFRRAPRHGLSG